MTVQTKAQEYADRCERLADIWGIGSDQHKFLNEVAVELRRIDAIKADKGETAQSQPQQEPVAIVGSNFQLLWCREHWAIGVGVGDKLYTSPPARKPLTKKEVFDLISHLGWVLDKKEESDMIHLTRAIEAAHSITKGGV